MPTPPVHGTRLDILEWLGDPVAHLPPQRLVDAAAHGAHAGVVAARLGVPRRVAGAHLDLLTALGLLRTRRIRGRTYYRRDEVRIAEVARMFEKGWQPPGRTGARRQGPTGPGPEVTVVRPGVRLADSRAPFGCAARRWGPPYPNRGTAAANGPYLRSGGLSLPGE